MRDLGEALYAEVAPNCKTKEDFEKEVREPLEKEATAIDKILQRQRVIESFDKIKAFTLPKTMLEQELASLVEHAKKQGKKDIPDDLTVTSKHELVTKANTNLKNALIIRDVIKANKIEVKNEDIERHVRSQAVPYIEADMYVKWFLSDKQRVQQAAQEVLETKAIESLIKEMATEEETLSFDAAKKLVENTDKE